jgi:predicted aspartyl protease
MKRLIEFLIVSVLLIMAGYYIDRKFNVFNLTKNETIHLAIRDNMQCVKVMISGYPLYFTLDTGCSGVHISCTEYMFLKKQGIKMENKGTVKTLNADGVEKECPVIEIKDFKIGDINLGPVECTVSDNPNAPTLIGQNVLKKLGVIQIDYNNNNLIIVK